MTQSLSALNRDIVSCKRCPRLVDYRQRVARTKNRRFSDWDYWGRPVPGYGDPRPRLLLTGLAPAAHGGNRTGRAFTGDRSGNFLMKCLYHVGIANQPRSESLDDGLRLVSTYITPVLKCVPPLDKPTAQELDNCSRFLSREFEVLAEIRCVLALGRIAFDRSFRMWKYRYSLNTRDFPFRHGAAYSLPDGRSLMASYHPSPRNVNTGRLTRKMMTEVLETAKELAGIDSME